MKIRFEDLSSVVRVTLREAIDQNTRKFTAKEMFWVVIGCGRMQLNWDCCSKDLKDRLLHCIEQNIESTELLPESVFYVSRALSKMNASWTDFSPSLRHTFDRSLRSAARTKSKIDVAVLDFFATMASLRLSAHDLSRTTRNAIFTRICRVDAETAQPRKLLATIQSASKIGLKYVNMPRGLAAVFISTFYVQLISDCSYLASATAAVRDMDFDWSILSDNTRKCVAKSLIQIAKEKHLQSFINAVEQLREFGTRYSDLVKVCPEIQETFSTVVSKSSNSVQSSLLKNSFGRRHDDLLKIFTSLGYRAISPSVNEFNQQLRDLKDKDLIMAIFILGQRVQKKRISVDSLMSDETLKVLNQRLTSIFRKALEHTDPISPITPAALESLLSSFLRLKVTSTQLLDSLQQVVSYFALVSRTVDQRTFIATMRSLVALGASWDQLSFADKFYLSRGIAKAASTCRPSKISSLLKVRSCFLKFIIVTSSTDLNLTYFLDSCLL